MGFSVREGLGFGMMVGEWVRPGLGGRGSRVAGALEAQANAPPHLNPLDGVQGLG